MRKKPSTFKTQMLTIILATALMLVPKPGSVMAQAAQTDSRNLRVQPSGQLAEWPGKTKRWALVIGVDNYKDGQIGALKGAGNDAKALAAALVSYAGFPPDQVILLATNQPEERQPTRVNILRRLSNLAAVVPKDGLLLIAFAGHGMERNGQAFLLPMDAQIADDISFLEETAISVNRMKDRIRATGVGQVVVILDACRNDPTGRADATNPLTEAYTRGFNFDVRNREVTAFATLYATEIGHRAYEYTEKRQGYFTWALIDGLKGRAANDRGEVTLARLVSYIQETVPKQVAVDLGTGKQQRPFAVVEGYKADELVIAVAGTESSIAGKPAETTDPAGMELTYWETIKSSTDAEDFRAYLQRYPQGTFVALASRRARLGETNALTATNPSALLTVDQILDRYLQAVGGKAAIEKATTRVAKGSYVQIQGTTNIAGSFENYAKAPNKVATIMESQQYGKVQQIFDGTVSWIKNVRGGAYQISGEGLARVKRESDFYREVNMRELYPTMKLIRKDKVGDRETYVIEAVPHEGTPDTIYFDAQSGLLVRLDGVIEAQKGKPAYTEIYFEDYREVDGLKLPFTMRQSGPGYNITIKLYEIKHNVPVDDAKFKKP
ncbi:MAG: caspase family protein [Acidobacteriota bacterium]